MMMNSFAMDESKREDYQKPQYMFQTSNFASRPVLYSPIHDKENVNQNYEQSPARQLNQSGLTILQELGDTIKTDTSITEEGLSLFERITHSKWQIRRKTYQELATMLSETRDCREFQQSWFKNIISDKHEFAFLEGLNLLSIYVSLQELNPNVLTYFIPDLLEKGSFLKSTSQQNVVAILMKCVTSHSEYLFVTQELFRKIESKHPKVVLFNIQMLTKVLSHKHEPSPELIRAIFRCSVGLLRHTNKLIRAASLDIFASAYSWVNESFEDLKKGYLKNLRQVQLKELETHCLKLGKRNGSRIAVESICLKQTVHSDLLQMIPEKFFEVPYMKPQEKRKKIGEFATKMEGFINRRGVLETNKDYSIVFSILISVLEESNFLLYSEAIRCVRCLAKLFQSRLPFVIARHFYHLLLDKLKGTLSKQLQSTVFSVLEDLMIYESISCDSFIEMTMAEIEHGKNMGVRVGCVRWLKEGWLQLGLAVQQSTYTDDGSQFANFIKKNRDRILKSLLVIHRKVQDAAKRETNLNFKQACMSLLSSMVAREWSVDVVPEFEAQRPSTADPGKRNRYDTDSDRGASVTMQNFKTERSDTFGHHTPLRSHSVKKTDLSVEFETPKTKKLDFDSDKRPQQGTEQLVTEALDTNNYEAIVAHLAHLRSTNSSVVFFSSNSHSPGGHWRRGMGRDNMIIGESRDSWRHSEELKLEQFNPVLEHWASNPSEERIDAMITIVQQLRVLFPQQHAQLTQFVLAHLGTNPRSKRLIGQCFAEGNVQLPTLRRTFIKLLHDHDQSDGLNCWLQLVWPHVEHQVDLDLSAVRQLAVMVVYMLPTADHLLKRIIEKHTLHDVQQIIEVELIPFKRLYSAFVEWLDRGCLKQEDLQLSPQKIMVQENYTQEYLPTQSFGSGAQAAKEIDLLDVELTPRQPLKTEATDYSHFDELTICSPAVQLQAQVSFGSSAPVQLTAQDILALYKKNTEQTHLAATQENRNTLTQVLTEQGLAVRSVKRNESIRQLQEIILTSSSLYFDIANNLIANYDSLDDVAEKIGFIEDLQLSIVNETLLEHINEQSYQAVLAIVIRLCTSPATQAEMFGSEESHLSTQLQLILDVLLRVRDTSKVVISLLSIFTEHLPYDFTAELTKNDKVMLRLTLKCIDMQIQQAAQSEVDVFGVLVQIYKFFKQHPPENLVEGLPSLKELEFYFRQMKSFTDRVMLWSPVRAKEFVDYVYVKGKSIYIDYLKQQCDKMLTI